MQLGLRRLVLDRRWDGVISVSMLHCPEGHELPGFGGVSQGLITSCIRSSIPGIEVHFAELPDRTDPADCLAEMHRYLHERGGLSIDELLLARCGRFIMSANSHKRGDSPTVLDTLKPYCMYGLGEPFDPSDDSGLSKTPFTLTAVIRAALTAAIAQPKTAWKSCRAIVREERSKQPVEDYALAPGRAHYLVSNYIWPHEDRRQPGVIRRGISWRLALKNALPEGTLHPLDSWILVSLRPMHPMLHRRTGNAPTRMRMSTDDDLDAAVAKTQSRARSAFPLIRAGISSIPQLVRQLWGAFRTHEEMRIGTEPLSGPAPTRNLETNWTHTRFPEGTPSVLAGHPAIPGLIAANLYETGSRCQFVLSAFVPDDMMDTMVAATHQMMIDLGYQEVSE
ncbi:hypothetical protein KRX51_08510 [Corynebacterium sp. TAE3-ERU12]|uniref:hypothetical protein n=1 Tax=Corynebacterium sp. TAE3-ERU12 TaxID=2849491 RepID=UPI001C46099E|nr:hypothetical protein [Corynebacterium sp. TAE3-ERU12]MBV7295949.1 hypothetical protein [Corynebacterium sp. TAE3-ERU12]